MCQTATASIPSKALKLPARHSFDEFMKANPMCYAGPAFTATLMYLACNCTPLKAYLESIQATPWGLSNAAHYTCFAILLSYAFHGFVCVHLASENSSKVQSSKKYNTAPLVGKREVREVLKFGLVYFALAPVNLAPPPPPPLRRH